MTARKRFTERQVLETLMFQGVALFCYRCRMPMQTPQAIEREHVHEVALGGADTPENCRYSHALCHVIVTNGTKATTAGSSKQRIAKVRRIAAGGRTRKGPKIASRGFAKKPEGYKRRWAK